MIWRKSDLSSNSEKTDNASTKLINGQEEFFPNVIEGSITAEETDVILPVSGTFSVTPSFSLTLEDVQNLQRLYYSEREENKRLQLRIEDYTKKLILLNQEHQSLIREVNDTIGSFEEKIQELTKSIKELEEARTRTFKLPESWIIEDEEDIDDL